MAVSDVEGLGQARVVGRDRVVAHFETVDVGDVHQDLGTGDDVE